MINVKVCCRKRIHNVTCRTAKLIVAAALFLNLAFSLVFAEENFSELLPPYKTLKIRLDPTDIYLASSSKKYEWQEERGFQPRKDVPPWRLDLPIDWSADPFKDENWKFQLHAWRMTDPIIAKYFETHEEHLFGQVISYIVDWWDYHRRGNHETPFSWSDMATGIRAMRLAFVIDEIRAGEYKVDRATAKKILAVSRAHVVRLHDEESITMGNHGIFQVHGLRLLCSVISSIPECAGAKDFSEVMMLALLDDQFTVEGVHKEHSPDYHFFVTRMFRNLVKPRWYDIGDIISKRILRAQRVGPWLVFPDGVVARIGDTAGWKRPSELFPSGDAACRQRPFSSTCYIIGDFSTSGYAVVRSDWAAPSEVASMLVMTGMSNGITHKHADELSFELYEFGQRIFVDSGKYGYNPDKFREYVRSVRAHNTVGLADKDLGARSADLSGSGLFPIGKIDGYALLSGQIERRDEFKHRRHMLYQPRNFLLIIDELWSVEVHDYAVFFHLSKDLKIIKKNRQFAFDLRNGQTGHLEVLSETCVANTVGGEMAPRIQGWESVGYLEMTSAPTIEVVCVGDKLRVVTLISFNNRGRAQAIDLLAQGKLSFSSERWSQ